MARLSIVWRNPKPAQRLRWWTHVRHNANRSSYFVLESAACGPSHWEGLPTLEVLTKRPAASAAKRRGVIQRFLGA